MLFGSGSPMLLNRGGPMLLGWGDPMLLRRGGPMLLGWGGPMLLNRDDPTLLDRGGPMPLDKGCPEGPIWCATNVKQSDCYPNRRIGNQQSLHGAEGEGGEEEKEKLTKWSRTIYKTRNYLQDKH